MSDQRRADSDIYHAWRYIRAMKYTITYIRLLVQLLKLDRGQQERLLDGTSLTPEMLASLDQQISQGELIQVLDNLLTIVEKPHLGLYVGSRMPVAAHGPLGQLLASSPDLFTAWEALSKYQVLRIPLVSVTCSANDAYYTFDLNLAEDKGVVSAFVLDTLMVTIQRGIELIIGTRLHDAFVELTQSTPEDLETFARYVPGQLHFGARKNRLRVPLELMKRPNPYNDPVVWEQSLLICEQLSFRQQPARGIVFSEQVRQLISQESGKLWTLAEIAVFFNITPRTVIRRLKNEGTKYQTLLDEELAKNAKLYLSTPSHTVESAALSLGYQDTSAFRRAFRRWCGVSPSTWRQSKGMH